MTKSKRVPSNARDDHKPRFTVAMARAAMEAFRAQCVDEETYAAQMRRHIGLDRHRN